MRSPVAARSPPTSCPPMLTLSIWPPEPSIGTSRTPSTGSSTRTARPTAFFWGNFISSEATPTTAPRSQPTWSCRTSGCRKILSVGLLLLSSNCGAPTDSLSKPFPMKSIRTTTESSSSDSSGKGSTGDGSSRDTVSRPTLGPSASATATEGGWISRRSVSRNAD